jgi:hypothetical protein
MKNQNQNKRVTTKRQGRRQDEPSDDEDDDRTGLDYSGTKKKPAVVQRNWNGLEIPGRRIA